MVPPIHLGAWSMALMLWLPFDFECLVVRADGRERERESKQHSVYGEISSSDNPRSGRNSHRVFMKM